MALYKKYKSDQIKVTESIRLMARVIRRLKLESDSAQEFKHLVSRMHHSQQLQKFNIFIC